MTGVLGDKHSYIKLIETWGSDERIIEAARMSTDKGFQGWGDTRHADFCSVEGALTKRCDECGSAPGDEKLLRYLWEHKHATPFEMAGAVIEVQAPIFVFREWHRHRTQSYNELSARYTPLPDLFYVPSMDRLLNAKQGQKNKQGSEKGFTDADARTIRTQLESSYRASREVYEHLLAQGVAREVARLVVPVAQYSRMRASANLRNWLGFLSLRLDAGAQLEIRQYANALATILDAHFPRTMELFYGKTGT